MQLTNRLNKLGHMMDWSDLAPAQHKDDASPEADRDDDTSTPDQPLTPAELKRELGMFTGTENYYQSPRGMLLLTDGMQYLTDKARSQWLVDAIEAHVAMKAAVRRVLAEPHGIMFWFLDVTGKGQAVLRCSVDKGAKDLVSQKIPHTDFPLPSIKLMLIAGNPGELPILLLPSEY